MSCWAVPATLGLMDMTNGTADAMETEREIVTEEELKKGLNVTFLRVGANETLAFTVVRYVGLYKLKNMKYGNAYDAHIWLVRFNRACGTDFPNFLPGILEIKKWIWDIHSDDMDPQGLGSDGEEVRVTFKGQYIAGIVSSSEFDLDVLI